MENSICKKTLFLSAWILPLAFFFFFFFSWLFFHILEAITAIEVRWAHKILKKFIGMWLIHLMRGNRWMADWSECFCFFRKTRNRGQKTAVKAGKWIPPKDCFWRTRIDVKRQPGKESKWIVRYDLDTARVSCRLKESWGTVDHVMDKFDMEWTDQHKR